MAFNVVGAGPQFIDTQTADADLKVGSCVKRSATGFAQAGANWRSLCLVLPDETVGGENSDTISRMVMLAVRSTLRPGRRRTRWSSCGFVRCCCRAGACG